MEDQKGTSSVFHESIRLAFAKAKNDVLMVVNEVNKMKFELVEVKSEVSNLKEKNDFLSQLLKKQDELIYLLKEKVEKTNQIPPTVSTGTSSSGNERVLKFPEEILLRQYRMHRRAQAKRTVLELVPETYYISLFDLYTKIVAKDQLCGKTTFYRYVKELCGENQISVVFENGQRKVIKNKEQTKETVL